ncbi:girdin [Cylas formicarius]|uniref:girdin n=1 Tax=Cylas formicarius TaxID=197179 RepID=UPI0029588B24|nr:girdin [Cylas formicarius]
MFKKLKDKITEEVKSSPQRFQQLTQSVTDALQQNSQQPDDNFFSIGDDDPASPVASPDKNDRGFSSVNLVSPSAEGTMRRNSVSSVASDVSFLPRYESSNMYHLQSDLDISASELEDNASTSSSQLGHLTKQQIYSAFQKSQMRYHKYRGRFTDLARHYKELERENGKMKSILVETQDKAIRRVEELKEQCSLEQRAKAHLEGALRDELDEKQIKINTLQTKIDLLQMRDSAEPIGSNVEQLETLTRYLNEARGEIEALNAKIQEYKAGVIVFQSKELEYKQKIASLERDATDSAQRVKENNLKLAENKMELHNELLSKDAEIAQLKRDLEALKANVDAYESDASMGTSTKLENLQSQNNKLIEKVESLTSKCNGLENELLKVEKYKMEVADLTTRLTESRTLVGGLKEGLTRCHDNIKQLAAEKQRLTDAIVEEKAQYELQVDALRESARKGLFTLEKQISDKLRASYEQRERQLRVELARLAGDGRDVHELRLELTDKASLVKDLTEEVHRLQRDLEAKEERYRRLETDHLELIEECAAHRTSVARLEQRVASLEQEDNKTYQENVAGLQNLVRTLQEQVDASQRNYHEKEKENVELARKIFELEEVGRNVEAKLNVLERKDEALALESTECDLLELKVEKLERERVALLDSFEAERETFNRMMRENRDLKVNEEKVDDLDKRCQTLTAKVLKLKSFLREREERVVALNEEKLMLEREMTKLKEDLRILEERDEAVVMDKTECDLLLLKVRQLEEEKAEFTKSFAVESRPGDQRSRPLTQPGDLDVAKENLELKKTNCELLEKVRVFEEHDQAVDLDRTETGLLKLKLQAAENERKELLDKFELERAMFDKLLSEHAELELYKEKIEGLEGSNRGFAEKVARLKRYLDDREERVVELQKSKLELEREVHKLEESLRVVEARMETLELDKSECGLLQLKLQAAEEEKKTLVESFEAERTTFEDAFSRQENREEQLEHRIADLELEKDQLRERLEKLVEENARLEGRLSKLNENVKKLSEEKVQIESQAKEDIRAKEKKIEGLTDSMSKLVEEREVALVELNIELARREENNGKLKEERDKLRERLDKADEENAMLKERLSKLDETVRKLNQDRDQIESQAKGDIEGQRKVYEEKITSLTEAMSKVIEEKEARKMELKKLNEDMARMNEENLKLSQEIADKEARVQELSTSTNELGASLARQREEFEELLSRSKHFEGVMEQLQLERAECLEKHSTLSSKLIEIEAELEKKNSQIEEMKKSLVSVEAVCKDEEQKFKEELQKSAELEKVLKKKIVDLKGQLKESKDAGDQRETLTREKMQLGAEMNTLLEKVQELTQENDRLQFLTPKAKECDYLKMQNDALQKKSDKLQQEVSELKVRVNQLLSDNKNLSDEQERSLNELGEFKARLEFMTMENDQKTRLEGEKGDLEQIQRDFYEIKGKCDALFEENRNLKEEYRKLEEQCNNFGKIKTEMERQYSEMLHEKQLLKDELQELKILPVNSSNAKLDNLAIVKQHEGLLNGPADLSREIEILRDKLTQYKSLDITNKSSIEFYEGELHKMKVKNEKLNRKLDETLVTLNHCSELSNSTEIEYLKNVLYNYMLGKESLVLARVIAAVCKFDAGQTEAVLQKEQQKQTLLGQLGLL